MSKNDPIAKPTSVGEYWEMIRLAVLSYKTSDKSKPTIVRSR